MDNTTRNTPPLLMGAVLVFWGWQIGYLVLGLSAAIVLEGGRALRWRWELAEVDYRRIWDLCVIVTGILFLFFYGSEDWTRTAFTFAKWLPLVFLPMAMAQWYGSREQVPYGVYSWLLRRQQRQQARLGYPGHASALIRDDHPERGLNFSYPYFALCLLATASINTKQSWFYAGFCSLCIMALWQVRPRRLPVLTWGLAVSVMVVAGYHGHRQLTFLQAMAERTVSKWITNLGRRDPDANESHTSMGQIGRIKLSGRVILRLETDGPTAAPTLLREASYQLLRNTTWRVARRDYVPVNPDSDTNDFWTLIPNQPTPSSVKIARYLNRGNNVLPLPAGTAQIANMASATMEYSPLGVVRVDQAPRFVNYRAYYGPGELLDSPPKPEDDLQIPDAEKAALAQIADRLQLEGKSPKEILAAIRGFFQNEFQYSLWQKPPAEKGNDSLTPLGRFLLKTRSGHCEFFASATVLLLRQAGLPARYATGYAVDERGRGNSYVVRARHAHAWCLVHVNGRWEDFDTTPASWNNLENEQASLFESLTDFGSWLWYQFNRWRYGQSNFRQYLPWLLIPLALLLAWRVIRHKQRVQPAMAIEASADSPRLGIDSEFYLMERRIIEMGFPRSPDEALGVWLPRIGPAAGLGRETWEPLLFLHYRYRFDPAGIAPAERQELQQRVQAWLERKEESAPSRS